MQPYVCNPTQSISENSETYCKQDAGSDKWLASTACIMQWLNNVIHPISCPKWTFVGEATMIDVRSLSLSPEATIIRSMLSCICNNMISTLTLKIMIHWTIDVRPDFSYACYSSMISYNAPRLSYWNLTLTNLGSMLEASHVSALWCKMPDLQLEYYNNRIRYQHSHESNNKNPSSMDWQGAKRLNITYGLTQILIPDSR